MKITKQFTMMKRKKAFVDNYENVKGFELDEFDESK
jgi:hypothetical protein